MTTRSISKKTGCLVQKKVAFLSVFNFCIEPDSSQLFERRTPCSEIDCLVFLLCFNLILISYSISKKKDALFGSWLCFLLCEFFTDFFFLQNLEKWFPVWKKVAFFIICFNFSEPDFLEHLEKKLIWSFEIGCLPYFFSKSCNFPKNERHVWN